MYDLCLWLLWYIVQKVKKKKIETFFIFREKKSYSLHTVCTVVEHIAVSHIIFLCMFRDVEVLNFILYMYVVIYKTVIAMDFWAKIKVNNQSNNNNKKSIQKHKKAK